MSEGAGSASTAAGRTGARRVARARGRTIGSRAVRRLGLAVVFVDRHAWGLVLGLALVALGLGAWGFHLHLTASGGAPTWRDALYLALQLFTLQSAVLTGAVEWQLEVARFLAPAVAAGAAARALAVFFYENFQGGLLRVFGYDHIIICGIGRKGAKLVEELRQRDHWVVVVESDPLLPGLDRCRALGATVLIGSASDPWLLRRACVWRARALVAVTGTDGANVETAVLAHSLNARRSHGLLRCVVHLVDRELRDMLARTEMALRPNDPFELVLFNVHDMCARLTLAGMGDAREGRGFGAQDEHLVIVGFGDFGRALAVEAAAGWRSGAAPGATLHVTIVDAAADALQRPLAVASRQLLSTVAIDFHQLEVHQPEFVDGGFLAGSEAPTAVFVSLGDDALTMYAALRLYGALRGRNVPIFVRMSERAGLAAALRDHQFEQGFVQGVRPIGLLEITCRAELVLGAAGDES